MSTLMRRIVDQKRQRRMVLAALTFPAKVRIVEQMRESIGLITMKGGAHPPVEAALHVKHGKNSR